MNLAELNDEIREAIERAESVGINPNHITVGVRSNEGEEFEIDDIYPLIRSAKAVIINVQV